MVNSVHRGVWNWLKGCSSVTKLAFSYGVEAVNAAILIPNETLEDAFLDGTRCMKYSCQVVMFKGVTFVANDDANISVLETVDTIAQWMEAQCAAGNYPELPEGCTLSEISVRNTQTGYAIAQDGLYAKYIIPFEIKYYKH